MAYVALGNPICSCQYRLQGGQRLFFKAGLCGVFAIGLIGFYQRMQGPGVPFAATALEVRRVLAWVQIVVLVVGGAGAIARALIRDHGTRMIESYRISPMNSATMVTGYLFGSTLQILLLYAVGLVLGLALSVIGQIGTADWLVGNFYLLVSSISIWSLAVFVGVGSRKPGNLTLLLVVSGFMAAFLMNYVPGLALFIGAFAVGLAQREMLGLLGGGIGLGVALAAAIMMTVFWSAAAARRYRNPYLPALGVVGSLTMVGLWLLSFLVGLITHGELLPNVWSWDNAPDVVLGGVLLCALIVGHLPSAAAVQMRRRHIMGARPHGWSDRCSPALASTLSSLLIVGMIAVLTGMDSSGRLAAWRAYDIDGPAWVIVLASLLLAVWTVTGLLRLSQFTIGRSIIASLMVAALWVAPPLIDHIRVLFLYGDTNTELYSFLAGCSPIVSIVAACFSPTYSVAPGLVFQFAVAVGAYLLGNRAEGILIRKRAAMGAGE